MSTETQHAGNCPVDGQVRPLVERLRDRSGRHISGLYDDEAADEIERLRALLVEACALFRIYEESHRAKGAGHEKKAERNADIAGRIEAALEA